MKKNYNLAPWQLILIALGLLFMFGPIIWDILTDTFKVLADIKLDELLSREGFFFIGFLLLAVVGIYELLADWRDKPKSKHIK